MKEEGGRMNQGGREDSDGFGLPSSFILHPSSFDSGANSTADARVAAVFPDLLARAIELHGALPRHRRHDDVPVRQGEGSNRLLDGDRADDPAIHVAFLDTVVVDLGDEDM